MARYKIIFNDNADSLIVDHQVGQLGFEDQIAEALWAFGDAIVAQIGPEMNPGYAVASVVQMDAELPIPRP